MFDRKEFFSEVSDHFEKAIEAYRHEISLYRTGSASPLLLDGVILPMMVKSFTNPKGLSFTKNMYNSSLMKAKHTTVT